MNCRGWEAGVQRRREDDVARELRRHSKRHGITFASHAAAAGQGVIRKAAGRLSLAGCRTTRKPVRGLILVEGDGGSDQMRAKMAGGDVSPMTHFS